MNISPSDLNHDYFVNQLQIRPDYAAKLLLTINSLQLELANKTQEIAELKEKLHSQQTEQLQHSIHAEFNQEDEEKEHTDNVNLRSPSLSMTPPSSYAQVTPSQTGDPTQQQQQQQQQQESSLPRPSDLVPNNNNDNNDMNNVVSFSMNVSPPPSTNNTEREEPEKEEVKVTEESEAKEVKKEDKDKDREYINDSVNFLCDKILFEHRVTRAWRWDDKQQKWRGRGKGFLGVYYCHNEQLAKILFIDERHDKTRLLQYIQPRGCCIDAVHASFYKSDPVTNSNNDNDADDNKPEPEENKEEVVWNGTDYVMDKNNPLSGNWKVRFEGDAAKASLFRDTFNFFSNKPNQPITLQDVKTINQETKDLVAGYIKNEFIFDKVPNIIYHWCLLYTYNEQRYPFRRHHAFHNIGEEVTVPQKDDNDTNEATKPATAITSILSAPDTNTIQPTETITTTTNAAILESDAIFRQNITIPDDKEESMKFVGKPINFDEVKLISQKLKDKVCGYIREAQEYFPWKKNIFYTIPQQVYHWCLLYIDDSFPKMVRDVYNNNINTQIGSVRAFRKLLSSGIVIF